MKVLILTGKFGLGHYAAAQALLQQVRAEFPGAQVVVEDLIQRVLGEGGSQMLYRGYGFLVSRGSQIYNRVYRRMEQQEEKRDSRLPFQRTFFRAFEALMRQTGADAVISVLPFMSRLVYRYKAKTGRDIPLITCVTDVCCHSEWIWPLTDAYLVAAESTKRAMIEQGVDPSRIRVSGVPVRASFRPKEHDPSRAVRQLLVVGGGLGLMPKSRAFYAALNRIPGVKTTVITGGNRELLDSLQGRFRNIQVLGFVDDMERHLRQADLLLSKPGGITLFEALACGTPLLCIPPFLEQEVENARFIEEHGIGVLLSPDQSVIPGQIERLIHDQAAVGRMCHAMAQVRAQREQGALAELLLELTGRERRAS